MDSDFSLGWPLDALRADLLFTEPQSQHHSYSQPGEQASPVLLGGSIPTEEGTIEKQPADGIDIQPEHRPKRKKPSSKRMAGDPSQARINAGAGEGSKKRGRPRSNAADETAAERRRTQIRLAQRAYRMRKETVITSLSERVAQLECTLDEMSKTFLAFNDDVVKIGLLSAQPGLAQLLRRTTQRFIELSANISRDSDDESQGEATQDNAVAGDEQSSLPRNVRSGHGVVVNDTVVTPHGLDVSTYDPPCSGNLIRPPAATILPDTMDFVIENKSFFNPKDHTIEGFQSFFSTLPLIRGPGLQSQSTYCYQETTFSRRVHRRCLEFGYLFLTDPSLNAHHISPKFRFTFGILTRERLAQAFHTLLQNKAGEPLEFWNKPFFYVGRAGMHYPRRDESGYEIFPPNMHPPERAFGPLPFHNAESPHPYKSINEMIEAIGFGGDWFDCHDVEGYLLEKGIRLYSRSSYVLVPRSFVGGQESSPAIFSSTNSPAGSHNSATSIIPPLHETQLESTMSTAHPTSETYYPPQNELGSQMMRLLGLPQEPSLSLVSGPAHADMTFSCYQQQATLESLPPLVLDVDRFVVELCQRSVCLGRAPGFRKHDVDAALAISVREQA